MTAHRKLEKCLSCDGWGLITTRDEIDGVIGLVEQESVCRRCDGSGRIDPQFDAAIVAELELA